MKIKKLFTILTVLCFSALAGVVFLKFVDNKKNARDIALANVGSPGAYQAVMSQLSQIIAKIS